MCVGMHRYVQECAALTASSLVQPSLFHSSGMSFFRPLQAATAAGLKRSWELLAHTHTHRDTLTQRHTYTRACTNISSTSLQHLIFEFLDFCLARRCPRLALHFHPCPVLPPLSPPHTPHKHNVTKQTNKQTHTHGHRHTHTHTQSVLRIYICTFVCIENSHLARLQIHLLLSLSLFSFWPALL